jgi:hypothetical protein
MKGFKNHSVANLKDLSDKLMFNYVNNNLIPRLMVNHHHKDACLFDDNGNNRQHEAIIWSFKALCDYASKLDACVWIQIQETGEALLCQWSLRTRIDSILPHLKVRFVYYFI